MRHFFSEAILEDVLTKLALLQKQNEHRTDIKKREIAKKILADSQVALKQLFSLEKQPKK